MSPVDVAREELLAAVLQLVASRIHIEAHEPTAYDDAQLEMVYEELERTARAYVAAIV